MDHFGSHYNLENRLDNIPDTSKLHIHFLGSWGFLCVRGCVGNGFSRFELIIFFLGGAYVCFVCVCEWIRRSRTATSIPFLENRTVQ